MTFTDGLVDGTFMIAMGYVDSYDKSLSQIVVKESSKTTTITVNGLDAAARWTEEDIGGKSYLCISAAPIPEASTYAAIFGAIALGFAAYRRRK